MGVLFETLDAEKRVKKIEGLESYFRRVRLHKHRGLWGSPVLTADTTNV